MAHPSEQVEQPESRIRSDLRDLFSTPLGRSVFNYLLERYGMMATTFATDPYVSAFNEGRRSVVCELYGTLEEHYDWVDLQKRAEEANRTYNPTSKRR